MDVYKKIDQFIRFRYLALIHKVWASLCQLNKWTCMQSYLVGLNARLFVYISFCVYEEHWLWWDCTYAQLRTGICCSHLHSVSKSHSLIIPGLSFLMSCHCKCIVFLLHGAMGWSGHVLTKLTYFLMQSLISMLSVLELKCDEYNLHIFILETYTRTPMQIMNTPMVLVLHYKLIYDIHCI